MSENRSPEQNRVGKVNREDYWRRKIAEERGTLTQEEFEKRWGAKFAEMERLRYIDPDTGLLTRRGLEHQLGIQVGQAKTRGISVAVIMLDLDGLKKVNDEISHAEGNRAIKEMSNYFEEASDGIGIPGRYGGDEFALVCPDKSLEEARLVAEKIRFNLKPHMKRKGFSVSTSVGLTALRDDNRKVPILLNEADAALKRAKKQGKDQVVVFSPEMLLAA